MAPNMTAYCNSLEYVVPQASPVTTDRDKKGNVGTSIYSSNRQEHFVLFIKRSPPTVYF